VVPFRGVFYIANHILSHLTVIMDYWQSINSSDASMAASLDDVDTRISIKILDPDILLGSNEMERSFSENNASLNNNFQNNNGFILHENLDASELALPWTAQVVFITVYTATIILSVTGNLLVIVVLLSANRTRTEITVFLVNLAVADICMACFCMPFTFTQTMLGHWIFGEVMCPLVRFMQVSSVAVSIFTNMAIGIDRLVSHFLPFRINYRCGNTCLF
jgi:hypothetical protein